jgi:imidazolonepropionase
MEIMREGGGIGFTVEKTKLATDQELLASLVARLKRMLCAGKSSFRFDRLFIFLSLGTTYVECKTGYGLEWSGELRLLKLLEEARSHIPIGISITYCAAHAVPKCERKRNHLYCYFYFYLEIKPRKK